MSEIQENPPTSVSPEAEVIPDQLITLWRDGQTIEVSSRSLPALQAEGWLRGSPESLPSIAAEINLLSQQVGTTVNRLVDVLQVQGVFDPEDEGTYAAAVVSGNMLVAKLQELYTIIQAVYPAKQGQASSFVNQSGESIPHDPSQTPVIDPEGQVRVIASDQADALIHQSGSGWRRV